MSVHLEATVSLELEEADAREAYDGMDREFKDEVPFNKFLAALSDEDQYLEFAREGGCGGDGPEHLQAWFDWTLEQDSWEE